MNDLLRTRSFGQLLRSISLNMNDYSPQSIEISDSKSHFLATTVILGQAPRPNNKARAVLTDACRLCPASLIG